jgi:hypothetical protein
MSDRVVVLSIPQVRLSDITPGALASLDRVARTGVLHELMPTFPGLTAPAFATLVTGSGPAGHGIVSRAYYDRAAGRVVGPPLADGAILSERIWDRARRARADFRTMLWFASGCAGANVELLGFLDASGATQIQPPELAEELARHVGPFPIEPAVPLFGTPRLDQTSWIIRSAGFVLARDKPDLAIIRVPYLGHVARRFGPEGREFARAVHEVDRILGPFLTTAGRDATVIVVTETIAMAAADPVDVHRILRKHGLLQLRHLEGGGLDIDLENSPAFALPAHQVCHVYVRDRDTASDVVSLFGGEEADGLRWVLPVHQRARFGIDHPRSGDVVLVSDPDRWFRTDWWRDPAESPRGRRCPSGLDPESLRLVSDPVRTQGSLGAPLAGEFDRGVVLCSRPGSQRAGSPIASTEFAAYVLQLLGCDTR